MNTKPRYTVTYGYTSLKCFTGTKRDIIRRLKSLRSDWADTLSVKTNDGNWLVIVDEYRDFFDTAEWCELGISQEFLKLHDVYWLRSERGRALQQEAKINGIPVKFDGVHRDEHLIETVKDVIAHLDTDGDGLSSGVNDNVIGSVTFKSAYSRSKKELNELGYCKSWKSGSYRFWEVVIFLFLEEESTPIEFVIAHELRHAWQVRNTPRLTGTRLQSQGGSNPYREADANEFADEFTNNRRNNMCNNPVYVFETENRLATAESVENRLKEQFSSSIKDDTVRVYRINRLPEIEFTGYMLKATIYLVVKRNARDRKILEEFITVNGLQDRVIRATWKG